MDNETSVFEAVSTIYPPEEFNDGIVSEQLLLSGGSEIIDSINYTNTSTSNSPIIIIGNAEDILE